MSNVPRAARPEAVPCRPHPHRPGPVVLDTELTLGPVDTAAGDARATLVQVLALWGLGHLRDDAESITGESPRWPAGGTGTRTTPASRSGPRSRSTPARRHPLTAAPPRKDGRHDRHDMRMRVH
jgi:hypothetical protein